MAQTALIVGTSGIVGGAAAERLLGEGWRVYGLARRPFGPDGVTPMAADLQDAGALRAELEGAAPGGATPWPSTQVRTIVPQMIDWLPQAEGAAYRAAFEAELARFGLAA